MKKNKRTQRVLEDFNQRCNQGVQRFTIYLTTLLCQTGSVFKGDVLIEFHNNVQISNDKHSFDQCFRRDNNLLWYFRGMQMQ